MATKLETFLINIAIIEGKHYAWPNMDSAVLVKVDNTRKCTAMKKKSDCPYYNEYFVFEFYTTMEIFFEKVFQPGSLCRKRRTLGTVSLDVITVWSQPDHLFYHKWAILSPKSTDPLKGTQGYLKLSIFVITKGEVPKIPTGVQSDELEGNLLLPEGIYTERQRAKFNFDIYKCENLISTRKSLTSFSYVQITFAGEKVKTTIRRNTSNPIFGERLIITEPFPPLCQQIKIEVYHGADFTPSVHSYHYINLRSISNDKEEGFVPTFGPAYIHLYFRRQFEGYCGTLLLAITTEIEDELTMIAEKTRVVEIPIPLNNITEKYFNDSQETLLMASIFEVTAMGKKYAGQKISFHLTFGGQLGSENEGGGDVLVHSTPPQEPHRINKHYYFISYEEKKPCLRIKSERIDFRKRMYNSNMLEKISDKLGNRLKVLGKMFLNRGVIVKSDELYNSLVEALDYVTSASKIYLDIVKNYNLQNGTKLDKERLNMCMREMNDIIETTRNMDLNMPKRRIFQKLQKIHEKINIFMKEEQHTWPNIILWMVSGSKRTGFVEIPANDIIFSVIEEERGKFCGVYRTLYLRSDSSTIIFEKNLICKMDVLFWLGLKRHQQESFKCLPTSFLYENRYLSAGYIVTKGVLIFQCRAHVYQARINPGLDKSGLCDPYIQVILGHELDGTQVIPKTLNPVWNETLLIKKYVYYGSRLDIETNPPVILLEMLDKELIFSSELVGRCELRPVIKFNNEPYSKPKFPPLLKWHKIYNETGCIAEILAVAELLEVSKKQYEMDTDLRREESNIIVNMPLDIAPKLTKYRIEIIFWGVRNLKKIHLLQINKPTVFVQCGDTVITSDMIQNALKHSNFDNRHKITDVVLPTPDEYAPPIYLKLFDCRSFGIQVYSGVFISKITNFLFYPMTRNERNTKLSNLIIDSHDTLLMASLTENVELPKTSTEKTADNKKDKKNVKKADIPAANKKTMFLKNIFKKQEKDVEVDLNTAYKDVDDTFDWWTKFYASVEPVQPTDPGLDSKYKLKIYQSELELQPEFKGFTDILTTFEIYKGKRTGDETVDEENITAVFKGAVKIYRWPPENHLDYVTASGHSVKDGVFQDFPYNGPLRYVLRLYCIRAIGLRPKDLDGKSDPYLFVQLNDRVINDRENFIRRQVNPCFGRCFEFEATFPHDHSVTIQILDRDFGSSDDLIGQTTIDLENRFYTKCRATCGLAEIYEETGFCAWRDYIKPIKILENLCRKYNLENPVYTETSVQIGQKVFSKKNFAPSGEQRHDQQVLALNALWRWREMPVVGFHLVPEHVETRPLYHPCKPGIDQGKLQMWVDIFPYTELPPPNPIDIKPRKPEAYELRVIIWNTEDVRLVEDDFFAGEKKSDIYISAWLDDPKKFQETDVHYRSLTGEGNFNWRFIFPFQYLVTEKKIVIRRKESRFSSEETEYKIPAVLTLQLWDNDTFSADDILGTLSLELCRLIRGAKSPKLCNLALLKPGSAKINLFKLRRTRGWWPFRATDERGKAFLAGKLEAELEIVTQEEAEKTPVGMGRNDPQQLPHPNRPDTSFTWFKNPWKTCKYIVCKQHRLRIIFAVLLTIVVTMTIAGIYAFPDYFVKRLMGA